MRNFNPKKRRNFTLIEVLVVVMILVALAGIATPIYMNHVESSKVSTAKTQIKMLDTGVMSYKMSVGVYPDSLEDLVVDPGVDNWKGPYISTLTIPVDPWQQEYIYICPGETFAFDIISYGSDKSEGGEDTGTDLSNH